MGLACSGGFTRTRGPQIRLENKVHAFVQTSNYFCATFGNFNDKIPLSKESRLFGTHYSCSNEIIIFNKYMINIKIK